MELYSFLVSKAGLSMDDEIFTINFETLSSTTINSYNSVPCSFTSFFQTVQYCTVGLAVAVAASKACPKFENLNEIIKKQKM